MSVRSPKQSSHGPALFRETLFRWLNSSAGSIVWSPRADRVTLQVAPVRKAMTDPKRPRRRFRLRRLTSFSLRTALVAMTVLAVGLGFHMKSVRKQRASIAAVLRHGGGVSYDYQQDHVQTGNRAQEAVSTVPAWLLNMRECDENCSTCHLRHSRDRDFAVFCGRCFGGGHRLNEN